MSTTQDTATRERMAKVWDALRTQPEKDHPLIVQVMILAELRAMRAEFQAVTMGGGAIAVEVV
jgi:hypothetical protein